MFTSFTGNGFYCFTNSLHMTLKGYNFKNLPNTDFIECLTTIPFGNTYLDLEDGAVVFFNGPNIDPHKGLALAIETLGWRAEEHYGGSFEQAFEQLRKAVESGPALVGPVDLGYLTYNPNHKNLSGIDHFVVVLDISDEFVTLHDPAGFPFTLIPINDFLSAWRAEKIAYKRGPYTFRYNFKKLKDVSRQEMINRTLEFIPLNVSLNPNNLGVYGSKEALQLFANDLKQSISPKLEAHLIWFALPLAARRANDAAVFFNEANMQHCVNIQLEKAKLFGQANYYAVRKNWNEVSNIVYSLIEVEEKLISELN